jgi:hypothetical protein
MGGGGAVVQAEIANSAASAADTPQKEGCLKLPVITWLRLKILRLVRREIVGQSGADHNRAVDARKKINGNQEPISAPVSIGRRRSSQRKWTSARPRHRRAPIKCRPIPP